MGLMDELKNIQPTELGGTGKQFIDADTLVDQTGEKYRLTGVNAAEVEKVIGGEYKPGTAGGAATTDIIRNLANEQGYTNTTPQLDADGNPVRDHFDRILTDLTNDKGQSFSTELLKAGAFDVNKYTSEQSIAARDIAESRRRQATLDGDYTSTAFDEAAAMIDEASVAEGAKTQGFKRTLLNEAQRKQYIDAGLEHLVSGQVQVRRSDRDINNKALNPFSDSWEQGWTGVGEAAFGVAELFGTETGLEGVAKWGEQGIARQRSKLAEYGTTILDYKEVDGIGSAFEYLGNNLALSLPQMGLTAGAALATGGGSLALQLAGQSIPAAVYVGQTWNEMEGEKNAAIAIGGGIAQAALDKLGLDFIFKKGVAPAKILKKAQAELVRRGATKEAAEAQIVAATRFQIGQLAGAAQKIAKDQIAAKAVTKDLLQRAAVGASGEAVTEAAQEATAYLAATIGSDKEFNFEELNGRLISAAIAGGTLGGGLAAPGAAYNAGAWADVAYRLDPASVEQASSAEKFAAHEKDTYGRVASIEELAADAKARGATTPGASIEERAQTYEADQQAKPALDRVKEKALNVSALWQGSVRNIFGEDLKNRSRSARVLSDMFGGGLQRTFSGSNFESSKHHRVAVYKNQVVDPTTFFQNVAGAGSLKRSQKESISDATYSQLQTAVNQDGVFDASLVPADAPNRVQTIQLGKELAALGDRLHADQAKHDPSLGYVKNYLHKYKSLNKKSVHANKQGFVQALQQNGYSIAEANSMVDNILNNPEVADIDQAFSVVKGGIVPASHKGRGLKMSERPEFQNFLEKDIFANVSAAVKSAARYTAHRDYIGENGAVVNKLLDDMQAEGVSQAEVNKVAAQMKNYLDAESGNYKRPTSDLGKQAAQVQKNFMAYTTLAGLPLATISSFVEVMLINKGLRKDQIFGDKGSLQSIGKNFANTIADGFQEVVTLGAEKDSIGPRFETDSKQLLKDLGYYEWDVGAATTTGVSETNAYQQHIYEGFFKWTGLSGYTNFTRAARASLAGDYIQDKVETVAKQRLGGEPRTREIQEAEEGLRNLGIDVDAMVDIYPKQMGGLPLTPEEETAVADAFREGAFNFVNEAIALPNAANRPLLYQDPRFALFTQFQGFIATFTANHIPKLWGEYVKRGTPAMKYNAFALATTMIMMGFVSQYLKDLIKYGGSTPHLEGAEYIQRGVRASGLLGTGERVLDQFFPLYEQKSDGVGDWVFKTGSGESPALSTLGRIGKTAGHAIQGEGEKAAYYGLKSAPIISPFTGINQYLSSGISGNGWNFKGDK